MLTAKQLWHNGITATAKWQWQNGLIVSWHNGNCKNNNGKVIVALGQNSVTEMTKRQCDNGNSKMAKRHWYNSNIKRQNAKTAIS